MNWKGYGRRRPWLIEGAISESQHSPGRTKEDRKNLT
jgi:hypothetical protein